MKKNLTCVIFGIITCVMLSFGISGMVYAADVTVPESAISVGDFSLNNFTVTVGKNTTQLQFNNANGTFESYKFALCKTDGSVYKEYVTLTEALADVKAAEQRTLIKLLEDMQSEQTVTVGGITFDLNSFSAQLNVGAEIEISGYGELKLNLNAGANVKVSPFVSKYIILSLTVNDATVKAELDTYVKVLSFNGESQNKTLAEYLKDRKTFIDAENNKMLYADVQALKTYNGVSTVEGEADKYLTVSDCSACVIDQTTAKCNYCGHQFGSAIIFSNGNLYDHYETLSDALTEVKDVKRFTDATVKLYKDDTDSQDIKGGSFTLDANGKNIGFLRVESSNITITGNGTLKGSSVNSLGISDSVVVIENGTIEKQVTIGYDSKKSIDEKNTLTIKDGTFNGAISVKNGTLNIEGGTFNAAVSNDINQTLKSVVDISDGIFNGGVGFVKNIKDGAQASLTISCGEFSSISFSGFTLGEIVPENVVCVYKASDEVIPPTLPQKIFQNILIGRVKVESRDGTGALTTRKYYSSLEQALEKATAGDTITLKFDETIDKSLVIEKNLTLDLNGFALTMSGADSAIKVKQNITFNVVDSNSTATHTNALLPKGGVIINTNQGVVFGGGIYVEENAKLKMSGGSIYGCKATTGGAIYALGDVYISGNALITECENGIAIDQSGILYADGGKIQSNITVGTIAKAETNSNITEFYGAVTASNVQTGMYYFSEEQMQGLQIDSGYFKVSYYNGESLIATLVLKQGNVAVAPGQKVTLKNYTFICWATEDGETYEFTKGVTQNIKLIAKWAATQDDVAEIIKQLEDAKKELEEATQKGDADLNSKISDLSAALTTAEKALNDADKANKEALEKALEAAESTLQKSIDAVQSNLEKAQADLQTAIEKGDSDLSEQIAAVNNALSQAQALFETTATSDKQALEQTIANTQKSLQSAIDKVQSNLDSVKQELLNKNNELKQQNEELQTFITVVCVGVAITFVGMLSFVIWFFMAKRKGF